MGFAKKSMVSPSINVESKSKTHNFIIISSIPCLKVERSGRLKTAKN
jgi:hypothetical protein